MSQIKTFLGMLEKGQDSEMLRYTLGNAYFNEKDYPNAIEHLQKAVEMKPDYSTAWKVLGRALAANEALPDALSAFDRGLDAATANGDKQVEKEINVFKKRVLKQLGTSD